MKKWVVVSIIALSILSSLLYLELGQSKKPEWESDCQIVTSDFLSLLSKKEYRECYKKFGANENWESEKFEAELLHINEKYGDLKSYELKASYDSNGAFFVTYELYFSGEKYSAVFNMAKDISQDKPDCSRIFHFGISGKAGVNGYDIRIIK